MAAALFAIWAALSLLANIPFLPVAATIRRWDRLGLVPNWSFFAPKPVDHDLALLVRQGRDAELAMAAPWEIVYQQDAPRRPLLRAFWNPHSRFDKALLDLAQGARRAVDAREVAPPELSVFYLSLMSFVRSKLETDVPSVYQFGALQFTRSGGEVTIRGFVFLSGFHRY